MGTTTATRMTIEQFRRLPATEPFYYELRRGELVQVTRPKAKHYAIQIRLETLLRQKAGAWGVVGMEFAFRALPEYEFRVADVACLSQDRWDRIDPEDNLQGAPDLVIEVLSPSNTADEMAEKQQLCLENGSSEFWIVDPIRREIRVASSKGNVATYKPGTSIPLLLFNAEPLPVDSVFP